MSIKFLILFILISISLLDDPVPIEELKKYGSITLYTHSWVYMELGDYKKGDIIYLQITIETQLMGTDLSALKIVVCETDNYKDFNYETRQAITDYIYFEERDIIMYYYVYYTFELKGNFKYLIILTPKQFGENIHEQEFPDEFKTKFILQHNKYDYDHESNIFGIVLISILSTYILIYVIFFIIFFIRNRRSRVKNYYEYISDKSDKSCQLNSKEEN